MTRKRYCIPCDALVKPTDGDCPLCGADIDPWPENPREKGDDDGVEYADPRDHKEGLE